VSFSRALQLRVSSVGKALSFYRFKENVNWSGKEAGLKAGSISFLIFAGREILSSPVTHSFRRHYQRWLIYSQKFFKSQTRDFGEINSVAKILPIEAEPVIAGKRSNPENMAKAASAKELRKIRGLPR
jgi:hypothetical protein